MAKKLSELRAGMSQAAREISDGIARQMLAEMPLNELRQAPGPVSKDVGRSAACATTVDCNDGKADRHVLVYLAQPDRKSVV